MTYKEALQEIEYQVFRNTNSFEMEISKGCYKKLVEALKKQISRKPTKKTNVYEATDDAFYTQYHCPACRRRIISEDRAGFFAGRKQKYCDCGQALDWSDTE